MYLELPAENPLAKAIQENVGKEVWLVLKEPGLLQPSQFRAAVKSWTHMSDGTLGVDFESWQEYCDRQAVALGI